MARAVNAACWHCPAHNDSTEHTIFACCNRSSLCDKPSAHLGHQPTRDDLPDLLYGPDFNLLPENPEEKITMQANAAESFRLLYKMVENILSLKETEERARQATGKRAHTGLRRPTRCKRSLT